MKICPQCQNTYDDDTLRFCLQDGSPLAAYVPSERPAADWTETETVISPRPASYETQNPRYENRQESAPPVFTSAPPEREKTSTAKIVLLSLLGILVLSAIGGTAAYIVWKNSQEDEIVANAKPINTKTPVPNKNTSVNQNANSNVNANANANENVNVNTNANVATPKPKPTLSPDEIEKTKENVRNVIDDWSSSYESLDLEYGMGYYADTVDYYKGGRVGKGRVRTDKQAAFDAYDTIKFDISNVNITPDATGEKATAVFDKEWLFENSEKTNSGKVQQQLQFAKMDGKWKITSEKDLKVYYINR